jgi:SAM-dependent methyltransferase
MSESEVKERVRHFYDQVGWQLEADGYYQNARYEDLRPVSREYIHKCHMRVTPFFEQGGNLFLDAGSGPIQYPEYLTYSKNFRYRLCADISIVALKEARERIGEHGLFVVADVANLPFKSGAFGGVVSLHTLHHLPLDEQKKAYMSLYRVLANGRKGVVVNGWTDSSLMRRTQWLVRLMEGVGAWVVRLKGNNERAPKVEKSAVSPVAPKTAQPTGTFIQKLDAAWLRREVGAQIPLKIRVWRSVNVRFLRAVIHKALGGRFWLRLLFRFEENFPDYFGERGQYPLIIIEKK